MTSSVAVTSEVDPAGAVTSFIVPFMSAFASDLAHSFIASDIIPYKQEAVEIHCCMMQKSSLVINYNFD